MKKEVPVNFEIGFADSKILSYTAESKNVILILECWNGQKLKMVFSNFVEIAGTSETLLCDIEEAFESPLLEKALNDIYDEKPQVHNLKVFRLININDSIALEIVCESMTITKASQMTDVL